MKEVFVFVAGFCKNVYSKIAACDGCMVSSNAEGVAKVIESNGKYAFFMESASIQYLIERQCEITQIGGELDTKVRLDQKTIKAPSF